MVTTDAYARPRLAGPRLPSAEGAALRDRFPPRPAEAAWDLTRQDRATVLGRLMAPPFALDNASSQSYRKFGLIRVLDWLAAQPGRTWQDRWNASGAGIDGRADWRPPVAQWLRDTGRIAEGNLSAARQLSVGMMQLICADVVRPGMSWLLTTATPRNLSSEMARVRDPAGFSRLSALGGTSLASYSVTRTALEWVAVIVVAKGGTVADITVGDCLELLEISDDLFPSSGGKGPSFYQLLHEMGVFPAGAPATVRMFNPHFQGQLAVEQLVDRYDLACQPVRDLLVDYLRERQPAVDYTTLRGLSTVLAGAFWKDLENHHPGIDSLRLAPDVAAAWRERLQTKAARASGSAAGAREPRMASADYLIRVRSFYLDIAQWAADDPARWGQWAVACPFRDAGSPFRKEKNRRKSRMDQRTRERLPVLPALATAVDQSRKAAGARLEAARAARPGEPFTLGGATLRRSRLTTPSTRTWAEDPRTGKRRDLGLEEDRAFWAWAAVEVLRETGIRIEELTELSHHSLVQYRHPSTGQVIPLLHIAPSKTDQERLLVISPELADVLSIVLLRVRDQAGAVPLVAAYDRYERVWMPPMPLIFQRRIGIESRPIGIDGVRRLLNAALAGTGLTDASGRPLTFTPHDFRRIFTTEAVLNGMPPHIAQLILGHKDINTTMGYKAVYPEEAISGHRAFIARRRELRPSEEYRAPTDSEWEEFLGHFERRRLALGDCGRAYGTSCIFEHSCIRCPLLRVDPAQRPRLEEIRDNLIARISEARREGWTGEAEGLQVSLAAANNKLAQVDGLIARRRTAVRLGMPSFPDIAGRTADPAKEPA
jgi:integrase